MEIPVVTTPIGAQGIQVEGIEELPVYVAQGEIEFARSVVELLKNKKERVRLAAAGRNYTDHISIGLTALHSWNNCAWKQLPTPAPSRKARTANSSSVL